MHQTTHQEWDSSINEGEKIANRPYEGNVLPYQCLPEEIQFPIEASEIKGQRGQG